jgi:hypothetical protein
VETVLSAIRDASWSRALVHPRSTTASSTSSSGTHHAHILSHTHGCHPATAHGSSGTHPSGDHSTHTRRALPRHTYRAHPETHPANGAPHAHVAAHISGTRSGHRVHTANGTTPTSHAGHPAHSESAHTHAHTHHGVKATHHTHASPHHGTVRSAHSVHHPLVHHGHVARTSIVHRHKRHTGAHRRGIARRNLTVAKAAVL